MGGAGKVDGTPVLLLESAEDQSATKKTNTNKIKKVQVGQGDFVTSSSAPTGLSIASNQFAPISNIKQGTAAMSLSAGGKYLAAEYNHILTNKQAVEGLSASMERFAGGTTVQDIALYRALNGAAKNPELAGVAAGEIDRITELIEAVLSEYDFA